MIAVTKVPKKTPFVGDEVMFPRVVSSFPPATLFRASPIRDIPKRKKASPPRSDMTDAILMVFYLSFVVCTIIYRFILHYRSQ